MPRDYEPEKQCPAQVTLATRASKVPSPLQSRFAIAYNVSAVSDARRRARRLPLFASGVTAERVSRRAATARSVGASGNPACYATAPPSN
jgi:hypothetical protein